MNAEHPRDVDPSITGQPHQVTGQSSRPDGHISRTLGNWARMPAATPKQHGVAATLFRPPDRRPPNSYAAPSPYAAPRWRASQTAVDSRTPSSIARPQCAIQAAIPSGVPET